MSDAKGKIRKGTLFNRRLLGIEAMTRRVNLVNHAILNLVNKKKIKSCHTFLPINRNNELNTWPLVEELHKADVEVVLSVSDFSSLTMRHFIYSPEIKFQLNKFDIPEPINAADADTTNLEMILIPLLAADKNGNRIGYGKGFYDRLLADLPSGLLKVGVNLAPLFDRFDFKESHDVKLDLCITPFKTYYFHD